MSPDSELAKLLHLYSMAKDSNDEALLVLIDDAIDWCLDTGGSQEALNICMKRFKEWENLPV